MLQVSLPPPTCSICGIEGAKYCGSCRSVRPLVAKYQPEELLLIVDGSWLKTRGQAGAGLVLATAHNEAVIAYCAAAFYARDAGDAELQAIERGLRWAPVGVAWSDSMKAIGRARKFHGLNAHFIKPELRDPLHSLAHRLSSVASHRDWARLERLWIPVEVW